LQFNRINFNKKIQRHQYADDENIKSAEFDFHKKPCRSVLFSQEGGGILFKTFHFCF